MKIPFSFPSLKEQKRRGRNILRAKGSGSFLIMSKALLITSHQYGCLNMRRTRTPAIDIPECMRRNSGSLIPMQKLTLSFFELIPKKLINTVSVLHKNRKFSLKSTQLDLPMIVQ